MENMLIYYQNTALENVKIILFDDESETWISEVLKKVERVWFSVHLALL